MKTEDQKERVEKGLRALLRKWKNDAPINHSPDFKPEDNVEFLELYMGETGGIRIKEAVVVSKINSESYLIRILPGHTEEEWPGKYLFPKF